MENLFYRFENWAKFAFCFLERLERELLAEKV
jgi:hypothetical protein